MARKRIVDEGPKVARSTLVEIDGRTWTFIVYDNDGYSLVDPEGRHVVPTDRLSAEDVERYRA